MRDINVCIFEGRLTRGMELKYTNTGYPLGSFSMAVNNSKKVGEQWQDVPNYFEFTWWGKGAEAVSEKGLMGKGTQVFVQAHAEMQEWIDKESGQKRKVIRFICDQVQIGRPGKGATAPGEDTDPSGEFDDDIPF